MPEWTPPEPAAPLPPATTTLRWLRPVWLAAGVLSLATGIVGAFLPLLPTTPFVLLAAFCFSRGSERWDQWLVHHPRWGPMVRDWRVHRAVPRRAKQLATAMMTLSCGWAFWVIPSVWRWAPAVSCTLVALWLWSLPSQVTAAGEAAAQD